MSAVNFSLFFNVYFIIICLVSAQNNDLWETYVKCKDTLGQPNWLCDPYNKIYHQTAEEINDLLWRLQTDVPCYCTYANDCYRSQAPDQSGTTQYMLIQSGVVGAMIITTNLPEDFVQTAERIYNDAHLSSANCSNGLLIVYAMDGQKLRTYRGELTEKTLDSAQATEIMSKTMKELETSDYRYALPELVKQYISYLKGQTYDRQRTWEAMVGMIVAVVIVAFVASAAFGIFLASCCCKKRKTTEELMRKETMKSMKSGPSSIVPWCILTPRDTTSSNKKNMLKPRRATKISPKRLLSAQKRLMARNQTNGKAALLHPSSNEEPYYVISEPSTMYSTLPRDSPIDMQRNPYSRPYPINSSTPAITYPDSTISQAYLEPSHSPLPEQEVQRRDMFLTDEEEKKLETKPKPQ